jgi:chromosome segregation ATPase
MGTIKLITTGALLVFGLSGCTVMQLRNEVKTDKERLVGKENELKIEEDRKTQLQQDMERLQSDLAASQMSLGDLKQRLEQLQQANAVTVAETSAQRERKRERAAKLQKHQREVVAIEQSNACMEEKACMDEKQKRVQFLKEEIRKTLEILLHT